MGWNRSKMAKRQAAYAANRSVAASKATVAPPSTTITLTDLQQAHLIALVDGREVYESAKRSITHPTYSALERRDLCEWKQSANNKWDGAWVATKLGIQVRGALR